MDDNEDGGARILSMVIVSAYDTQVSRRSKEKDVALTLVVASHDRLDIDRLRTLCTMAAWHGT